MYLTENWRLKQQRYTLTGTRNPQTQKVTFPPRVVEARQIEQYDLMHKQEQPLVKDVTLAEAV